MKKLYLIELPEINAIKIEATDGIPSQIRQLEGYGIDYQNSFVVLAVCDKSIEMLEKEILHIWESEQIVLENNEGLINVKAKDEILDYIDKKREWIHIKIKELDAEIIRERVKENNDKTEETVSISEVDLKRLAHLAISEGTTMRAIIHKLIIEHGYNYYDEEFVREKWKEVNLDYSSIPSK